MSTKDPQNFKSSVQKSVQKSAQKPALSLETKVQYLKGVGPKLAELLNKREIRTVRDLIQYFPRAYEDRRAARNIASLKLDETVSLKAQILKVSAIPLGQSKRRIYDIIIKDSSGQIHCKFFRVPYKGYFERFSPQTEVRIAGKVIEYRGRLEFHHPDIREMDEEEEAIQDDLIPIYPEIENLSSAKIMRMIQTCMDQISKESWGPDLFPEVLRQKYHLVIRQEALWKLHHPPVDQSQEYSQQRSDSHRRIIFEEFFWLELYLAAKKAGLEREPGIALTSKKNQSEKLTEKLLQSLPFQMTNAQKRSFAEIEADLQKPHPMLGGLSPSDFADNEFGAQKVTGMLAGLKYGGAA